MTSIRISPFAQLAMLFAGTSCAAASAAPTATADTYAKAVLDCHAAYAHRYAKASSATPSEIAEGAQAACWDVMEAYAHHTADLVSAQGNVPELAKDDRAAMVHELSRHARALAVDTVIRDAANEALLGD